jgi:hypothetical protein
MLVFLNPKRRLEAYPSQVWTWGLNQLLFKYMMCIQSWVNSGYNYLKYVRQVGLQVLKYLGMKWAPIPFWFELQFIYIYIYMPCQIFDGYFFPDLIPSHNRHPVDGKLVSSLCPGKELKSGLFKELK